VRPATSSAYRLFHEGAIALSRMESVGLPVNPAKLATAQAEVTDKIRQSSAILRKHEIYQIQQRKFGKECSLGSRDQLAWVLYGHMQLPGATKSEAGRYKLDENALLALDNDYVTEFLKLQKFQKLKGTYLDAFSREIVDGRVYGSLNLNTVKSFRGSAEAPNLNNLPSRNVGITRYVKSTICPPDGQYIVEIDYSALEVHVAACYHKDPTMIDNLNTGYDMHTAVSKQCYKYGDDWIRDNLKLAKVLRTAAKSDAVFSWFYGNYYVDVALRLWKTAVKTGMVDYLASKGIKRLGLTYDFVEKKWIEQPGPDAMVTHIKEVEHDFWKVRYPEYDQWRRDWYQSYQQKGYCHTLSGFTWWGAEKRNFIINMPIQGSAFHLLLRAITTIDAEIRRTRMRSRLFLEVHDSLLAIVPKNELHDYVAMANYHMTTKIKQDNPWVILPLKTETEISDVSWFDKVAYTGRE